MKVHLAKWGNSSRFAFLANVPVKRISKPGVLRKLR
jgi:hypothetical protein